MMHDVFKQLQELQDHLEELPSERQAVFTNNCDRLVAFLQEWEAEFQLLLFPDNALKKLEKVNCNLELKVTEQAAIIRQLEKQVEQWQKQYKRATQSLAMGEARLQTMLRNSSELITIIEPDGIVRDQNPVVLKRILGYKPQQRIGEQHADILHPDDVPAWEAYFAKLLKQPGIAPPIECRKLHANGYWVYLEVIGNNLLHDSSINGITLNCRDITQRKLSESALAKSQQQVVNILENITDGFYALDRHWQFTYVNPKAEECWQKQRQELLGKNIWEEFPDTADTIFFKQFYKALSENVAVKFEGYYQARDIWLEIEAYPSEEGLSVFFRNITARKISDKALEKIYSQLEQQTKLLDSVLSTTPDRLLMFDRSQRLTYINRAALELTRLSEACVFGKTLEELGLPPELITLHHDCWENILATGQNLTAETDFINPRTGRKNYCSYIFSPILRTDGTIEAVLVTNRDITEFKETEAALRESESRYRIVSQVTSDFAYSFNVLPDRTWACDWMTEAFTRITGYTPEEIEISGWPEGAYIHPDDKEMLREQAQDRSSGRKEVSEYRIVTKTGEIRWLWDCRQVVWDEVTGCAVRIYGACQDITEHKLAQAKQCETNLVVQELIKALPLGVIAVDANAVVTQWNPAAEKIFGWNESEVLGELLPIIPSEENVDFYAMFQSELEGVAQIARECRRRRKDGALIDVCIWTVPMLDADGSIRGSMRVIAEVSSAKWLPEKAGKLHVWGNEKQPFWTRYVRIPHLVKK